MTMQRPKLREPRDPNQCLRLPEVAKLVGVKPRTIKSWVAKSTFPRPIKPTREALSSGFGLTCAIGSTFTRPNGSGRDGAPLAKDYQPSEAPAG